jgi:hypothetical protein
MSKIEQMSKMEQCQKWNKQKKKKIPDGVIGIFY